MERVMPITAKEAEALVSKWGIADDVMLSAQSRALKKLNIVFDTADKKLILPVKAGTRLSSFNPEFTTYPGITITPKSLQNFSAGPVKYTVTVQGKEPQTYEVIAKEYHNTVLDG